MFLSSGTFFYYGGWADKLEYAFPNRKNKTLVLLVKLFHEFPLLMAA